MKTKPKRIRALVRWIDIEETIWSAPEWGVRGNPPSEPCYILRQSDVRAMAEQITERMNKWKAITGGREHVYLGDVLEGLKAIGIRPGREIKTDGSLRSVKVAIKNANVGDIVVIPPGKYNLPKKGAK